MEEKQPQISNIGAGGHKVLFVPQDLFSCGFYRCVIPAMAGEWRWWSRMGVGNLSEGLNNEDDFDIFVFQRMLTQQELKTTRELRQKGKLVFYEIDDYMHGIGKLKGFHGNEKLYRDKKLLHMAEVCMRESHGVIVSTQELQRRYKKYNPNIFVIENAIDEKRWQYQLPQRQTINVGWAGAQQHSRDLLMISHALKKVQDRYAGKIQIVIVGAGQQEMQILSQAGIQDIIHCPSTPIDNYPSVMTHLDIGLAPLHENAFSRCKSNLKALELGVLGIPAVVSGGLGVYESLGNLVLYAYNEDDWINNISLLIENDKLRHDMGQKIQQFVYDEKLIKYNVPKYVDLFDQFK